jgi:rhamnopyranosyl-N-acetylglucosaminyl-diphospho-decaprenol beta-1,3/1,4-galactofuranosyltransferase
VTEPVLRLVAIVVTYNRLDHLRRTVARLLDEGPDAVLVVDNASDDGTAAWLADQPDPRLSVLRLAENAGGAGGFEAGLAEAGRRFDPDWCVLMDDDARPRPGALARFRKVATAPPGAAGDLPGVIAAAVEYPDGQLCEMNRVSRNPFWHLPVLLQTLTRGGRRGFHLPDAAFAPDAPPARIDVASFVGFFVSRAAIARGGLPDGGLFIYGDDVIYSLRLRKAGVGIVLHPAIRFEHDCATVGAGLETRPLWKVYYLCRNGVYLAREAAGRLLFPLALLWYLGVWLRKTKHYDKDERPLYRALLWAGLRDGLLGRTGRRDDLHRLMDKAATDSRARQ